MPPAPPAASVSSTPFRRLAELTSGIELPDLSIRDLREQVVATAGEQRGQVKVLTLGCEHSAAAANPAGTVLLPCVAMAPPSLIDFILTKGLADGVVVAGCSESACYHRLGVEWTRQRFAGERNPYLRDRVPRERLRRMPHHSRRGRRVRARIDRDRGAPQRGLPARGAD